MVEKKVKKKSQQIKLGKRDKKTLKKAQKTWGKGQKKIIRKGNKNKKQKHRKGCKLRLRTEGIGTIFYRTRYGYFI